MAEQRFVKTNAPGLNVGETFKTLVLHTVAAKMAERGADIGFLSAIMNEIANMTTNPVKWDQNDPYASKNVGKAVAEYMQYRFADGGEPEWHRILMDGQNREQGMME